MSPSAAWTSTASARAPASSSRAPARPATWSKPTSSAPTRPGSQALPNGFGVQILAGASDNLVGGTDAAAGNLIAFNSGPGVDVEGDSSVGNQITANRIFANGNGGALQFDGSSYVSLPQGLINPYAQSETLEAGFQTTSGGVILGYQSASPGFVSVRRIGVPCSMSAPTASSTAGRMTQTPDRSSRSRRRPLSTMVGGTTSPSSPTAWPRRQRSTWMASSSGRLRDRLSTSPAASTRSGPDSAFVLLRRRRHDGWYRLPGQIADVRVWSEVRTADEVKARTSTTAPSGTEPGLVADYPLHDGQGQTAHDLTSNHNDGTLAGLVLLCQLNLGSQRT